MSQLIVAVKSCWRDRQAGFHDAIRSTWGADIKAKGGLVRFFLGHEQKYSGPHPSVASGEALKSDEQLVDAPDDYMGLPFKTRGICGYLVTKNVDNAFICDIDTIINVPTLLSTSYRGVDYGGHFRGGENEVLSRFDHTDHLGNYPNCYAWASGGVGYFLSRPAMMLIADTYPFVWAEDMSVGQILGPEIGKGNFRAEHLNLSERATWHFRKSKMYPEFTTELLYRIHKEGSPKKVYDEALASQ
jgi:Galactosyltransferase